MRSKREAGDIRPLSNHNYLKRVLDGTPEAGAVAVCDPHRSALRRRPSATLDAVQRLETIKRAAREEDA